MPMIDIAIIPDLLSFELFEDGVWGSAKIFYIYSLHVNTIVACIYVKPECTAIVSFLFYHSISKIDQDILLFH